MVRNYLLVGLLISFLPLGGCLTELLRYVQVAENIEANPLLDPNTLPINRGEKEYFSKTTVDLKGPCRIKLTSPSSSNIYCVQGKIFKGRTYTVLLDTGCPYPVMLDCNVVRENALPIYPINEHEPMGFCELQFLKLGDAKIYPIPSFYLKQSWQLQLLGISLDESKLIILGLQSMRLFKYVLFDNIDREVELSTTTSFVPSQFDQWLHYPFELKNDEHNQLRLFVNIPIGGKDRLIPFDTGLSVGLQVDNSFFANHPKISETIVSKKSGKLQYHQFGWLDFQKVVLSELKVGDSTIYDAEIHVIPAAPTNTMLGTSFFKNTIIVLDFEKQLMWIKK